MVKGHIFMPMAANMSVHSKMVRRLEKPLKLGVQRRLWPAINISVTSPMTKKTAKVLTPKPTEPLTLANSKVM